MLNELNMLHMGGLPVNIDILLFGNDNLFVEINTFIFSCVQIVVKYKINLYSLQNRPEKLAEGSLFCLFLKLVQINFIFTDNVRILYMYFCTHENINVFISTNRLSFPNNKISIFTGRPRQCTYIVFIL
jgi:hypothetical protein